MEEAAKKARVAHDVIWTLHHGLFPAKASEARTTKGEKAIFFEHMLSCICFLRSQRSSIEFQLFFSSFVDCRDSLKLVLIAAIGLAVVVFLVLAGRLLGFHAKTL